MMTSENSALLALSELQTLEADRVQLQQQAHRAAEQSAREAAQQAERLAHEQAEQRAQAQAAQAQAAHQAQLAREREERIRVQEIEMQAQAEHQGRLLREQARLDAQVRMGERRARPRWPLAVVPVLVLGVLGVGVMTWQSRGQAEREAAEKDRAEQFAAEQANMLAAVTAKLGQLEADQERMSIERAALASAIDKAKDDEAARAALETKLAALDAQIAENAAAREQASAKPTRGRGGSRGSSHGSSRGSAAKPKPTTTPRTRPRLEVEDSNDPLAGIERNKH